MNGKAEKVDGGIMLTDYLDNAQFIPDSEIVSLKGIRCCGTCKFRGREYSFGNANSGTIGPECENPDSDACGEMMGSGDICALWEK